MRHILLSIGFCFLVSILSGKSDGQQKKVLVIGVDGLRSDAMEAASTPTIDALIANGTYSRNATTSDLTFSGPGWSDILLGVHRDAHGVQTNATSPNPDNNAYEIFTGSNQHNYNDLLGIANTSNPSLQTARFIGEWNPLHTTRSPSGDEYTFQGSDSQAAANASNYYANNNADVGFIYFANPDFAGHANGFHATVTAYTNQITATDAQIGTVISSIQNRTGYQNGTEDWVFILASDHGGDSGGGHGGNAPWQREVPIIVSGNSVQNKLLGYDAKNVDVVATALSHLEISLPDYLAGHAIGLNGIADPRPTIGFGHNLIFNGDAEYDHGFTDHAMDQAVTGWDEFPDADFQAETSQRNGNRSLTVLEYGTAGGFPDDGDPGPIDRGENFFSAGAALGQFGQSGSEALMKQTIDVSSLSALIDSGNVEYEMSAFLGGFSSQSDKADLVASFRNENGVLLGQDLLLGPTAFDRGNQTGLFYFDSTGDLPIGTHQVELELLTFGNDGYADNLTFSLLSNVPEPGQGLVLVSVVVGLFFRRKIRKEMRV